MASSRLQLLTTTTRIVVAIILTAYVFALAVRDALVHHNSSHLLSVDFFGLNGWWLVAVNVAFYGYMCWLAFCFIRGTAGTERLFVVCWFTGVLLWPLAALRPEWSTVEHYVSSVALGMALFAAGSLLFKERGELDPDSTTEAE
jgi:hypothetical protein